MNIIWNRLAVVIPKYLPPVALFLSTTSLSADIITLTERTRLSNHDDISFFLRMPSGWAGEVERDFFGNRKASVKGVLMICTHRSDPEEVKANLSDNSGFQYFIRFADEHNLALVTWTNLRGYVTHTSGDEMDEREYREYDRNFNARSREWESGYRRLANRYHLPRENILLYGASGGGQQAHRLALRKPEYFAAVHIHINSSYDVPTRDANRVLWLVTTGTREYGYPAGERFYRQVDSEGVKRKAPMKTGGK